jgi:hypothetical protein
LPRQLHAGPLRALAGATAIVTVAKSRVTVKNGLRNDFLRSAPVALSAVVVRLTALEML